MIKFSNYINESKDLSYKKFFGGDKVSHQDALKERIRGSLVNIIMQEKKVSEKSFNKVDEIVKKVKDSLSDEIYNESESLYNQGKRISYIAELIYDKYIKD